MGGFSERLAEEEEGIGTSMRSFLKCLESQKGLFHSQIDEMQRIVVTQCQLTGVNPLSQEMAAGALSIPIAGKKPRDLLNPKAVAYMQAVFAIKDKISKKEAREISAQFGITLAQVRDFFASQRTRVREIVQVSQEIFRDRSKDLKELEDGNQENKDPIMLSDPAPLSIAGPITCDTNILNAVTPAISETAPQSASKLTETDLSTVRCDSPEFSLATCIPITDEEDISDVHCKTEIAPQNSMCPTFTEPHPLNVVPLTRSEPLVSNPVGVSNAGTQSKLRQEEVFPGLDGSDKNFIENIFNLMSKEKTFSGQVKLMEGILKIENLSVLDWFLAKGGVMILATWLGEAAIEEQTSVLHIILKVLCHLPLAKAVPEHMSVILQSVNSLRFYRTQDISKKARILLARWSKLFAKSQPMRKTNGVKSQSDVRKQTLLSQSINEIISDESRQLRLENVVSDGNPTPSNKAIGNIRKRERPVQMELLTASSDESMKRKSFGLSSIQGKYRRKVQLVEHPGQKLTGRSQQAARASVSQSRPVSTDDIQKAKLRKEFMEAKYGKKKSETESSKQGISQASPIPTQPLPHERMNPRLSLPKSVIENKPTIRPHPYPTDEKRPNMFPLRNVDELKQPMVSLQSSTVEIQQPAAPSEHPMILLSSSNIQSQLYSENGAEQTKPLVPISSSLGEPQFNSKGTDEQRQPIVPESNSIAQQQTQRQKTIPESKEPFWKQCKRVQISWKTPPEIVIDEEWRVGAGQNSRELSHQKARNKREKEFVYQRPDEIPKNPKNPWENEMDYDDSLTPVIPIEQVLDSTDALQTQNSTSPETINVPQMAPTSVPISLPGGAIGTVHDPELLAVLLQNPVLVQTLMSGQGTNMTSEDIVRLLDSIKASGGAFPTGSITHSLANGVGAIEQPVEGSLPSPTPSSNFGTSGWQPVVARNPFSRNSSIPNTGNYASPGVAAPAYDKHPPATNLAHTQLPSASNFQQLQSPTSQFPLPQTLGAQYNGNFTNSVLHSPTPHAETISSVKPYQHPISNETGMLENRSTSGYNPMHSYSSYPPVQTHQATAYDHLSQPAYYSSGRVKSQQQPIYEYQSHLQNPTYETTSGRQYGNPGTVSDSWRPRGLTSDSYAQVNVNHYGSTNWYKTENVMSSNQFESWSPPNSGPSTSVDYVSRSSQPRTAYDSNYRPDQSRPMNFSSGYGGTNQNGNGWWNEHEKRR
ncbi:unnamed protein product [Rhodiola kirilowii]